MPSNEAMPDELEYTKKLLEIEYAQVRSRIDAVDDTRFKLKGWAIGLSTGLLALGFNRGQRWIMLLSLPVAVLLCLIEADYLLRQDALRRRSDDLEEVMEALRRHGPHERVDSYVFGVRTISPAGYSGHGFPRMFGSRSRAGWAYVTIVVITVVSVIIAST
jgi:hypothetical protein